MFASSTSFSKKQTASLPKMASPLRCLTEDLNLLSLFDHNIGLTTKCAKLKVSENVEKDVPLQNLSGYDQHTKKTLVECVTINSGGQ